MIPKEGNVRKENVWQMSRFEGIPGFSFEGIAGILFERGVSSSESDIGCECSESMRREIFREEGQNR